MSQENNSQSETPNIKLLQGILSNLSGKLQMLTIQKNNIIRINKQKIKKRKKT
jgi:hypothetical protein